MELVQRNVLKATIRNQKRRMTKASKDYKLERLKFILSEISNLNQNTRSILSLYQALSTLIISAGVYVFTKWNDSKIEDEVAIIAMNSLKYLLAIVSVFCLLRMGANISSWIDLRNEEVEFMNYEVKRGFRKKPSLKNFWRWDETYIILLIVIILFSVWLFVDRIIIAYISNHG